MFFFTNVGVDVMSYEFLLNVSQMSCFFKGPRPNTLDDFWRMIWQQDVNLIVMITQLIEKTKVRSRKHTRTHFPSEAK